jgi:hypothetical protein
MNERRPEVFTRLVGPDLARRADGLFALAALVGCVLTVLLALGQAPGLAVLAMWLACLSGGHFLGLWALHGWGGITALRVDTRGLTELRLMRRRRRIPWDQVRHVSVHGLEAMVVTDQRCLELGPAFTNAPRLIDLVLARTGRDRRPPTAGRSIPETDVCRWLGVEPGRALVGHNGVRRANVLTAAGLVAVGSATVALVGGLPGLAAVQVLLLVGLVAAAPRMTFRADGRELSFTTGNVFRRGRRVVGWASVRGVDALKRRLEVRAAERDLRLPHGLSNLGALRHALQRAAEANAAGDLLPERLDASDAAISRIQPASAEAGLSRVRGTDHLGEQPHDAG